MAQQRMFFLRKLKQVGLAPQLRRNFYRKRPKAAVIIKPDNHVFIDEIVTLTCNIENGGGVQNWRYSWNKEGSDQTVSNDQYYSIWYVKQNHAGKYTCTGTETGGSRSSHPSDAVLLTVSERPKPAVIINPDNHVFMGERVTLTCNIENGGGVQNWRYSWNKEGSDRFISNKQQYRISDVTENHAGKYTCTGTETGGSRSSHPSDAVLLTVSAKPKPTVRLEPQNFIYTGDTVTLTCDLNQSTGWTFIWYRNDQEVNPQISAAKITTNKLSEKLSNTGTTNEYKCRARRGKYYTLYSDPVIVTVEGEIVTLTCNIENGGGVQNWRYSWNKEGSDQTVSNDQQYRINNVTENHAGKYTCTGTETGGSRSSHPSDAVLLTVSAKPKPNVRLEPQNFIYTGDTVTLTCDLNQSTGWTFIWYRNDQEVNPQISADKITTNKLSEKLSNPGTTKYKCRAQRENTYEFSNTVTVTVEGEIVTLTCNIENGGRVQNWRYSWNKEGSDQTVSNDQQYRISDVTENHAGRPKATVIINPDNQVFIGETVTLTCNIENGGGVQNWSYSWNKEGSDQTVSNGQQYRISDVTENHAGKYTCTGTETGGSRSSHPCDAVLLTISAKPKPTVRLEPQNFIYTGDTVTLTCDLNQSTGWTFIWYRNDQEVNPQISADKITTNKLSEKLSNTGTTEYKCRARREKYYSYYSEFSDPVTVTVEERPKPTVIINPDNHVFIGEIVTLTCNIENGGGVQNWSYSWNKEGSDQTVSNDQQYRISDVTENHAGKYTCTGTETGRSRSSHPSDAVLLTVSERPKPVVIINPDNHVFIGETVTLTCNIENGGEKPKPELTSNHKVAALAGNLVLLYCELNPTAGWNFYWYKHTQNTETETTTHPSYTIYSVSVSDGGQYWCRAGRGTPVYYTHYSSALWVNVTGESSSVSLIINPSRTQHFTDESLSLSCVDQSKSTEWRVRRYTDHQGVLDCSSVSGSATCNISSLNTSHTGVYWCESESGGSSNPVNITVHGGDVILESPVHPVTEGESLTLHCLYRKTKPSNLRADFYKDGSVVQNQTSGEMMIHQVSKSDEGFYHCKYPEGGESPKSLVLVVGDTDTTIIVVAGGLGSALLLLVLMILLCCCKRNKDTATEPSDVTYAEIDLKPKKKQKKSKVAVRGAKDVIYSDINLKDLKTPIKGAAAEPSDMTYADIDLKLKKPKRSKGKTSVGADTVYSELKQNTDKGDSFEANDSTYAQVNKKSKRGKTALSPQQTTPKKRALATTD
ncbi:leukocyte immunoglobulin-like receptor subfamily B member 3-like [Trichomycterus rosablanca]|uniref:leukocyte immunoglobulin-like receptor subfamily B member 3-like n=1 Tax=Trichomycterus rosablanca TaxID=2290929 RepID=UPI002F35E02F